MRSDNVKVLSVASMLPFMLTLALFVGTRVLFMATWPPVTATVLTCLAADLKGLTIVSNYLRALSSWYDPPSA